MLDTAPETVDDAIIELLEVFVPDEPIPAEEIEEGGDAEYPA